MNFAALKLQHVLGLKMQRLIVEILDLTHISSLLSYVNRLAIEYYRIGSNNPPQFEKCFI